MNKDTFFNKSGNSPTKLTPNTNDASQCVGVTELPSTLLGHPFIGKLPPELRLRTLSIIYNLASDRQSASAEILCLAIAVVITEVTNETGEKQQNWRNVLKAFGDDWGKALDCADEILKARHKRLTPSYGGPVSVLSNFRPDLRFHIPDRTASLIDHAFLKCLPEALRFPTLKIFYSLASDDPNPAAPKFLVVRACAIATQATAGERGATHRNGRILLSALAESWENAVDFAKQILLTRPKHLKMHRVKLIAQQVWALNTGGRE